MIDTLNTILIAIIALSLFISFVRFLKGPTATNRVMALDSISINIVISIVFAAFLFQRYIYVDVALVYGVIGFVGVLTTARFLEGGL